MNLRLSFVIPTRNQARFLRECIDGCLAQGIERSEIVIVDGLSTDDTREVLASYGDRVRWISEKDRGQSDALNKGIRMAHGELVAWINSDDYYAATDVIGRIVAEFDRDPMLDIVSGDGLLVDIDGKLLRRHKGRAVSRIADIVTRPLDFVLQPCLIFRRQLYLDVGGVDERLHLAMDYDLWIRLFAKARRTRYLPMDIACARYHLDAKSVSQMGAQIREAGIIKWKAVRDYRLSVRDRMRTAFSMASLGAYYVVTRLGLKRTY